VDIRTLAAAFAAKAAHNWPAKALSFALALFLFIFHRMSTMEDRFFSVPLNVEVSSRMIPSSSYPRTIRIRLKGEAASVNTILEDDIEAYIDLAGYEEPGPCRAPVRVRKKGTALGVEPLEIRTDPTEVRLSVDTKVRRNIPLTASIRGQVEQGYNLTSYSLNPTEVSVEGPAGLMSGVSELATDAIDLNGRTSDFSVMVNILNRDPLLLIIGNGMTEFRGFVVSKISSRVISEVPITLSGLADRFTAEAVPASGSVRLEGLSVAELDSFTAPEGFLSVDCSEIAGPGEYELPVKALEPPSLTVREVTPAAARVRVTAKDGRQ